MTSGDACNAMNSLGEVVPGDDTLVGEMINARHNALFDGSKDGHSQITCIGGCAYLVEDDTQFRFLLTQTNHRLHEVITEGGIQPGSTDDHRLGAELLYIQFTHELGLAIDAVRTCIRLLGIGRMLGTIEDIVSGDLDHPSAAFSDGCCQVSRCLRIQLRAEFFIVLSLVDSRISRTVDNAINMMFLDKGLDSVLVGDIKFLHIRIKIAMLGVTSLQQLHFVS